MSDSGIYLIQNTQTKDLYVGSSAVSIKNRLRTHKTALKSNRHENQRLQNSWNKYGEKAFIFYPLFYLLDKSLVVKLEQLFIDRLKPTFNICPIAGNCLGRKFSEDSKKKMSESAKKRGLNEFLLKQQQKKLPEDKDGKRFCSKEKHWETISLFGKSRSNVCKSCLRKYRKPRTVAGSRTKDARKRGKKIICERNGIQIGFYAVRHAVEYFKSEFPKINKTHIRKYLDSNKEYYNMIWKSV